MSDLAEGYLSPHFRKTEFACHHCGRLHPSEGMPPAALLNILEAIRAHFGQPVTVHSGYRCEEHNRNVGGAERSRHVAGDAADIKVRDVPASAVFALADRLVGDTGGVGRYPTFTHIDVRGYRARWG